MKDNREQIKERYQSEDYLTVVGLALRYDSPKDPDTGEPWIDQQSIMQEIGESVFDKAAKEDVPISVGQEMFRGAAKRIMAALSLLFVYEAPGLHREE